MGQAIASKYLPGSQVTNRPWGRLMVSRVASFAVGAVLTPRIGDYSNGYRFYSRAAAEPIAAHRIRYANLTSRGSPEPAGEIGRACWTLPFWDKPRA